MTSPPEPSGRAPDTDDEGANPGSTGSSRPTDPGPPAGAGGTATWTPARAGLLDLVATHALDEDYRQRADVPRRRGLGTLIVLAAFALLLVTAASQTSRNAVADEGERLDLIKQVEQRRAALDADQSRLGALQQQIVGLRADLIDNGDLSASTRKRLAALGVSSGTVPVQGPGVRIVVDDNPRPTSDRERVLDTDLQQLVNGLWQAGAEAIAINGQRLTNLSAIREAGSAITVNYRSLDRPYVVKAIGDPGALPVRFADTSGGQTWLDLRQQVGLRFSIATASSLVLPAVTTPTLRYAQTVHRPRARGTT